MAASNSVNWKSLTSRQEKKKSFEPGLQRYKTVFYKTDVSRDVGKWALLGSAGRSVNGYLSRGQFGNTI